jgi:hypothetical protein
LEESDKMPVPDAFQTINAAVTAWPGVSTAPHRFGGVEFRLKAREVGHIHGNALVDVPFPRAVRDELISAGAAEPHHVLPESGWVSVWLRERGDVNRAIAALQRSYELALAQQQRYADRAAAAG